MFPQKGLIRNSLPKTGTVDILLNLPHTVYSFDTNEDDTYIVVLSNKTYIKKTLANLLSTYYFLNQIWILFSFPPYLMLKKDSKKKKQIKTMYFGKS